jgi:hypothetical protein
MANIVRINGKPYTTEFVLNRADREDAWADMMERNKYTEKAQQARNLAAALRAYVQKEG